MAIVSKINDFIDVYNEENDAAIPHGESIIACLNNVNIALGVSETREVDVEAAICATLTALVEAMDAE